jgi:hypothetical protein
MGEPDAPVPAAETQAQVIVCGHCGCDIDVCAFCDEERCAAACCYGCLVIELSESMPALHSHGG